MSSILSEIREKARQKQEEINADPNATEQDKKLIADTIEFLKYEISFKKVPRSTVLALLRFIGCSESVLELMEIYDKIIEEIDRVYILVDPEQFQSK